MGATVTIRDETTDGRRSGELTLDFLTERVTAREIIRARVYQEVREHNARSATPANSRIEPGAVERALNGPRPERDGRRDWQAEYARALDTFGRRRFLLLVDDRQILDLDEEVELQPETAVVFLRLVPLIGG